MSLSTRIHESGVFVPFVSKELAGSARNGLPDGLLDEFAREPERFFAPHSARSIKNGRKTQLARATLRSANGAELDVIVKKFRYRFPRRLGFFLTPTPAQRSLAAALLLERNGFHTPAPVAALDGRGARHIGTSYYIAEELKGSLTLGELWRTVFLKSPTRPRVARVVVDGLARLLYRLHAQGIYHRDLKSGNILVRDWANEERRFFIVDLDRVEVCRRLSSRRKIKNLLQVRNRDWSARERIRFFLRYGVLCGLSRSHRHTLARGLLRARLKDRSFLALKAPF